MLCLSVFFSVLISLYPLLCLALPVPSFCPSPSRTNSLSQSPSLTTFFSFIPAVNISVYLFPASSLCLSVFFSFFPPFFLSLSRFLSFTLSPSLSFSHYFHPTLPLFRQSFTLTTMQVSVPQAPPAIPGRCTPSSDSTAPRRLDLSPVTPPAPVASAPSPPPMATTVMAPPPALKGTGIATDAHIIRPIAVRPATTHAASSLPTTTSPITTATLSPTYTASLPLQMSSSPAGSVVTAAPPSPGLVSISPASADGTSVSSPSPNSIERQSTSAETPPAGPDVHPTPSSPKRLDHVLSARLQEALAALAASVVTRVMTPRRRGGQSASEDVGTFSGSGEENENGKETGNEKRTVTTANGTRMSFIDPPDGDDTMIIRRRPQQTKTLPATKADSSGRPRARKGRSLFGLGASRSSRDDREAVLRDEVRDAVNREAGGGTQTGGTDGRKTGRLRTWVGSWRKGGRRHGRYAAAAPGSG